MDIHCVLLPAKMFIKIIKYEIDKSGIYCNRQQIVNFPFECGTLMHQLFTICGLTTFLGFHVKIAGSIPSMILRIMQRTPVTIYYYSTVSKVHETVTGQRSCMFIISS